MLRELVLERLARLELLAWGGLERATLTCRGAARAGRLCGGRTVRWCARARAASGEGRDGVRGCLLLRVWERKGAAGRRLGATTLLL